MHFVISDVRPKPLVQIIIIIVIIVWSRFQLEVLYTGTISGGEGEQTRQTKKKKTILIGLANDWRDGNDMTGKTNMKMKVWGKWLLIVGSTNQRNFVEFSPVAVAFKWMDWRSNGIITRLEWWRWRNWLLSSSPTSRSGFPFRNWYKRRSRNKIKQKDYLLIFFFN